MPPWAIADVIDKSVQFCIIVIYLCWLSDFCSSFFVNVFFFFDEICSPFFFFTLWNLYWTHAKWLKLWICNWIPLFCILSVLMSTQCSVCVITKHIGVFFFLFSRSSAKKQNKKKLSKKKTYLCESGNVVIVFARKMCNIRFSDGSRFQRRTPMFKFCTVFLFSSQFLRSLNAFWSWGWPGNLRTYTNAPEIQKRLDFTLVLSLSLFSSPLLPSFCFSVKVFSDFVFFFYFQVNTGTYSGVLFLASFCIIVIYCTCNELVSFATFNSRSFGSRVGLEFLTYKNYRGFCQILSVYFINKCL